MIFAAATAFAQTLSITDDASPRLVNLAVRNTIPAGETLIAGFVVSEASGTPVLARAVGPSLAPYGVTGTMPNPKLQIIDSQGRVVAENDDWTTTPIAGRVTVTGVSEMMGAFPLTNSAGRDAAVVAILQAGVYSLVISGSSSSDAGVVLGEIYQVPLVAPELTEEFFLRGQPGSVLDFRFSRLINLSVRCRVSPGADTIAGFVVGGGATPFPPAAGPTRRFLIRVVGPTLANFSVQGAVADTTLELAGTSGRVIKTNDNWDSNPTEAAEIRAAMQAAGAFPLEAGSRDAAVVVRLLSGPYTVQARGTGNATSGTVLIEIYELAD